MGEVVCAAQAVGQAGGQAVELQLLLQALLEALQHLRGGGGGEGAGGQVAGDGLQGLQALPSPGGLVAPAGCPGAARSSQGPAQSCGQGALA